MDIQIPVCQAREISLLRIVALGLAGPKASTPAEVVARLGCVQAQDLPGALESVASRTSNGTIAHVERALNSREIVRSWPMRATLHLCPPRDLAWMLALTRRRMEGQVAARHRQLGIDEAMIERAAVLALAALAERETMSRTELLGLWESEGFTAVPQRGQHLILALSIRGLIVQGPRNPSQPRETLFARTSRWIPDPRSLSREEALAEWVETYLRSHGPAPLEEFARWTGLSLTEARQGLAEVAPTLASLEIDGVPYWMAPDLPDLLAAHRDEAEGVFFLPSFDELILGYRDRSATVPAEFAGRIAPGGNGMFRPTVVDHGQAVGTWAWARRGPERITEAVPFTRFTARQLRAIEARTRST